MDIIIMLEDYQNYIYYVGFFSKIQDTALSSFCENFCESEPILLS